jgi:UDPglucose--hexose-1-phosphate uridylyltransferase
MTAPLPHRRLNPLTGEFVLVSPQRMQRPWQGAVERPRPREALAHDPSCYLCPGNARAGGAANPWYESVFVFDNDFPALLPSAGEPHSDPEAPWLLEEPESGICRVLCYSRRGTTWGFRACPPAALRAVVDAWAAQVEALTRAGHAHVQVFENRGEAMGCSNPHPHGQIWATRSVPNEVGKEDLAQAGWRQAHARCLLCQVAADEAKRLERVVLDHAGWLALVPFWAVWPFELLLVPKDHVRTLPDLDDRARDGLADLLRRTFRALDALFGVPMPLSWGWHGAPALSADREAWHLHAHVYPPLLRSATVRKFMVGYEMLAGPQRDMTAEVAAERLRAAAAESG